MPIVKCEYKISERWWLFSLILIAYIHAQKAASSIGQKKNKKISPNNLHFIIIHSIYDQETQKDFSLSIFYNYKQNVHTVEQFAELVKAKSIIMLCDKEINKHAEMLVHALIISAQNAV